MAQLNKIDIEQALDQQKFEGIDGKLTQSGLLSAIVVKDGQVGVILDIAKATMPDPEQLRRAVESFILTLPNVKTVSAVLTSEKQAQNPQTHQSSPNPASRKPNGGKEKIALDGVKHVVAIASGKGGVGKSTTSINLAIACQQMGLKVGLLDADIFGPSFPTMLGDAPRPPIKDGVIQPVMRHGMKTISVGYLVDHDQPIVWRGPKLMGAVQQLFKDVDWSGLDILFIDLPPGTGDVQLTMAQQFEISGAVIVSTPQDLALTDARKGLAMFQMVDIPILGIIENMSHYHCPHCGERSEIFGHGGAKDSALEVGCDFLGEIPLHISVRERGDSGTPLAVAEPDNPVAKAYGTLALKLTQKLGLAAD